MGIKHARAHVNDNIRRSECATVMQRRWMNVRWPHARRVNIFNLKKYLLNIVYFPATGHQPVWTHWSLCVDERQVRMKACIDAKRCGQIPLVQIRVCGQNDENSMLILSNSIDLVEWGRIREYILPLYWSTFCQKLGYTGKCWLWIDHNLIASKIITPRFPAYITSQFASDSSSAASTVLSILLCIAAFALGICITLFIWCCVTRRQQRDIHRRETQTRTVSAAIQINGTLKGYTAVDTASRLYDHHIPMMMDESDSTNNSSSRLPPLSAQSTTSGTNKTGSSSINHYTPPPTRSTNMSSNSSQTSDPLPSVPLIVNPMDELLVAMSHAVHSAQANSLTASNSNQHPPPPRLVELSDFDRLQEQNCGAAATLSLPRRTKPRSSMLDRDYWHFWIGAIYFMVHSNVFLFFVPFCVYSMDLIWSPTTQTRVGESIIVGDMRLTFA